MANTLSVWRFESADAAAEAEKRLLDLQNQELITVHDAATVSWPFDSARPKTQQLHSMTKSGALGGAFWGLVFGLIFFLPLLGAAIGAATGGLAGSLSDIGIDDEFIDRVRKSVTKGSSALFVLTSDVMTDAVADAFKDMKAELVETNLDPEREKALREVFAGA
jgi:uncharacterized membrane protein